MPLEVIIVGEGLIGLLLSLALVGVLVWVLITYAPMPSPFKNLIIFVAIFACVILALRFLGVRLS